MPVMFNLRLSILLAACLVLLAGQALAASPLLEIKDLKQPVAAGSITTFADLLKLVHPDLKPDGGTAAASAGQGAAVRHLDDSEIQPLTGEINFWGVTALPIRVRNQPLLLLYVYATGKDGEEGSGEQIYDLLALFHTGSTPKLLDLVDIRNVGIMQTNGLWTANPLLNLTPATQACLVFQEHFNSSQSYLQIRLLGVRNQRLEELLGVSPFGSKGFCESFATKAVFWTEPDKGREYPRVVAKLTVKMEPSPRDEACRKPQRGFTRSYRGAWQWDKAKQKFQMVSGNLDQLYKWYDKYY